MDCNQCLEQLDEFVFIEQRHPSAESIELHLASCTECQQEFDSMREAIALIPLGMDANLLSDQIGHDVEQRVMEQIVGPVSAAGQRAGTVHRTDTVLHSRFWKFAFAATVVTCIATAYTMLRFGNAPVHVALSPEEQAEVQAYASEMKKLRELESVFSARKMHYVSLYETDLDSRVAGYLVYDLVGEQVHFFGVFGQARSR